MLRAARRARTAPPVHHSSTRKKGTSFGAIVRSKQKDALMNQVADLRTRLTNSSMERLDPLRVPSVDRHNVTPKELRAHSDKLLHRVMEEASSVNTGENVVLMNHLSELLKENAQLRVVINAYVSSGL